MDVAGILTNGFLMEVDSNGNSHKMDVKVKIKGETLRTNGTSIQVKSECEEDTDYSSEFDFVALHFEIDKQEIKEDPWWLEIKSNAIKQEIQLPSAANGDLQNDIKEPDSHIEVITGDVVAEDSSGLLTESMCRNDRASCFLSHLNSGDNSWRNSNPEASHFLSSREVQVLEEAETNYALVSQVDSSRVIQYYITPHKCEFCGKRFRLLSDLKKHVIRHEGKLLHTCDICKKSFTRANGLRQHKLKHEGIRYNCELCDKTYTSASNLKEHKFTHEGIKPYECEICKKSFHHSSNLSKHKLTHKEIRSYMCEFCCKSFKHISTLKRHIVSHEDKGLYMCKICNRMFINKSTLLQHKLTHGDRRPHTCEICKKNFKQTSHLTQHKLTHAVKIPDTCKILKKSFTLTSTQM